MSLSRFVVPIAALVLMVTAAGCTSGGRAVPIPVTSTSAGTPTSTPTPPSTTSTTIAPEEDPALNVCDDTGIVPCMRQVVQLSLPVAGADVRLTYSSDRAAGRTVDRAPSADAIGLGGWSLSVLDSYDSAGHTLITGSGVRRTVSGVAAGNTTMVAAADGRTVDVFDARGRQTARMAADTGSALLTFAWTDRGLASVSGPSGVALTVLRLTDGTPARLVATDGAGTKLGTVAGRLAAVIYPDGSRAAIGVSPAGLVSAMVTAAGELTQFDYDQSGRLIRRTDGAGGVVRISRKITAGTGSGSGPTRATASSTPASSTAASSTAASSAADTAPPGSTTAVGPGSRSATTSTTLPTGGTVTDVVTVDGRSTQFRHTDATGVSTTVTSIGNQRVVTGPDGVTTTITQAPDPRWGTDAPLPASVTAGNRTLTSAVTGAAGRAITRTFTVDGQQTSYTYDPGTRTASRTYPGGSTTTVGYDRSGRVQRSTGLGALPVAYVYGPKDRLTAVTVGAGPDARTWHYAYSGHTIVVTDPVGGVQRRDLTATGAPLSVTGPGQNGQRIVRDSADRITAFAAPGAAATAITWGANGRIAAVNAPAAGAGDTPAFTGLDYDATGALIKQFTADTAVTITRDAAGRALTVDPGTGSVAVGYDSAGRLTTLAAPTTRVEETWTGRAVTGEKVTGPVSTQINRTLTESGRTAAFSVTGGRTVDFSYDAAGRVVKAGNMSLGIDPASGQVTRRQLGTLTDTLSRNQFGELLREAVTTVDGTPVAAVSYTRDHLGRVTGSRTEVAGAAPTVLGYTYDSSGRLLTDTVDGTVRRYSYDQAGNLIGIAAPTGATTLTYDRRNALTSAGGTTYAYDGAGRRASATTSGAATRYSYDALGRLLGVKATDHPDISYTVDGFGRRIATASAETTTSGLAYQDSQRPAARLAADGSVSQQYIYTDGDPLPAYLHADGRDYLEIADASGGPGLVLDRELGTVVDRTVRTGYGLVVSEQTPDFQPIGFAGGIVDPGTGLVRFGARDYDPATAGWTAPDPLSIGGGSANLYQYVGGDPVNRRDPSGAVCDYMFVGGSFGLELGPLGFTVSGGLATAGTQLGLYGTAGASVGVGGGLSVTGGCDDATAGHNPDSLDTFGGLGQSESAQAFIGESHDTGFDDAGNVSSVGDSASLGFGLGMANSIGKTGFLCIFGCPDQPAGAQPSNDRPDRSAGDNNADQPGGGDCAGGQCTPSPSDPGGDGAGAPDNACAGGGCADPANNADSSGGPDNPAGSGARTTGDPHLRTADNTAYDFQAVGEFTWLADDSGDLTVQVRQQPFARSRTVSINTAVAVNVSGDKLMVTPSAGGLVVTGVTMPGVGTFSLPHGTTGVRSSTGLRLTLGDGSRIWVRQNPYGLDVNVAPVAARRGHLHGLAGPFTGSPGGGVQTRTGKALTVQQLQDRPTLYRTFGDSWRIDQRDSLFTDQPGTDATAFDDPTFPVATGAAPSVAARAAAQRICAQLGLTDAALADCVLDVAVTGDAGFASSAAQATNAQPGAVNAAGTGTGSITGDITPGATVSGHLSANGRKSYSFDVPAGAVAYFSADPGCRTGTDIRWQVIDPTGSAMTGFSTACDDLGRVRFPVAGRYQLLLAGFDGGSGPYRVSWTESRPDATAGMAPDSTHSGNIDKPGAFDILTMPVTAGTVVYLQAATGCAAPAAGTKGTLRWTLLDPSGSALTGQYSICDDIGRVRLDQAGTYRLVIESIDGGTGSYSVRWVASRPDRTATLSPGATASGTLDKPGTVDERTLTVTAGTVGYFAAAPGCTAPAGSGSVRWQLLDPSGTALTGSNQICDDLGRFRFATAGTYRLRISSYAGGTGDYAVTWLPSRPDIDRPLSLGQLISGAIDQPGAQDGWTFTLGAATPVTVEAATGCTSTGLRVEIQDSQGVPSSGSPSICDGLGPVTLAAGSYRVLVHGDGPATGKYSFTTTTG